MRSVLPALLACLLAASLSLFPAALDAQAVTVDTAKVSRTGSASRSDTTKLQTVRVVASPSRKSSYSIFGGLSATKTPTLLRDVPQAVTVVTQSLMRDQAMQSMADVVRYIPGITMGQGEGNRDQPTIRGNSSTADFFVDGVRDDVQYFRDLYNLERVEALKGSNAMIFGRGGGGGVLNRVTKEAQWTSLRELTLQGGSFDNKRVSLDVGQALSSTLAGRVNGVYEHSGHFRDGVSLRRSAINPTLAIQAGRRTLVHLGYEYFTDRRTADRGIPSFQGRPAATDVSTFFGNAQASMSDARVNSATATVSHRTEGNLTVRNRTRFASYDKFYQNVFPGAMNASGDQVSISAYNNATQRQNLFNQTDITAHVATGRVRHTLLAGAELGRQHTDNFRNTGYFDNTATSILAPISQPRVTTPVTFRQSPTDADNRVSALVGALYVQDQIALSPHLQLIGGVRVERFDLHYVNQRTDSTLQRHDAMITPRAGLLIKPAQPVSFYTSYSISYLPSAGDQFSSLTDVTKALEPERFANYEVGAKWDVADRLALTAAAYRLDRTNTRAPDPLDPTKTVQTGSQRTTGLELGVTGDVTTRWQIAGGYTNQKVVVTSTTSAARTGARVPLVPRTSLSLWNKVQVSRGWGVGLGAVHRSDMYAAIDNTVTLPGYVEVDGAVYVALRRNVQLQANTENLGNTRYFASSNGNNNISPGAPRTVRVVLTTGF